MFRIWIPIKSGQWIRIRNRDPDPEGQKCPTKIEKRTEISCSEVLDALFRRLNEGFLCSLDILYGGLGISKLQFLFKYQIFSALIVFLFLVIKILDSDWIRIGIQIQPKMLDPDPEHNIIKILFLPVGTK